MVNSSSVFVAVCFCVLAVTVQAFTLNMVLGKKIQNGPARRSLKDKEPKALLNLPRKIKRMVRSAATADKFNAVFSAENDNFIKGLSQPGLRDNIMHAIAKKAAYLKIPVKAGFGEVPKVALPTIIEAATKAGSFKTLLAAVQAADLTKTLSSGQFTVFAPSDEAFAALPEGTVEGLLADIPKLTTILTYHVLPSIYKAKKVLKVTAPLVTVNAEAKLAVKVDKNDKSVTLGDGVKLVTTDIMCSNGVIHVVDKVLMPK